MPEFLNSCYGIRMTLRQVAEEIVRFMRADERRLYRVTVGTDSEKLADGKTDFVSAVVVHRVGNGARYFWRRAQLGKFHTLRDRIIKEVVLSLDLAKEVLLALQAEEKESKASLNWEFEIHADVGEHGETKAMIQEVVGMIRGHNFEVRTKPESYAASNVADRHV